MKKKWQQLSIFLLGHSFMILFIITGLVFLGFNLFTPYVADDYTYMGGKSLLDMLHKEYMQYMNMNGRSVAHFLARVFLSQNKILFDVINTGMFLWLTYCIYLHANGTKHTRVSKNISALTYLFIPCSIWLFVDVIRHVYGLSVHATICGGLSGSSLCYYRTACISFMVKTHVNIGINRSRLYY